ncbi:MAG: hypothetical protein ACRDHZ_11910 [Ktedonobacteraceae bacterium]
MHYWNPLWNSADSVRQIHSGLEGWALGFFALLVIFEVIAFWYGEDTTRGRRFTKIGILFFAAAVLMEIAAYPFSEQNDFLASQLETDQRQKISELDHAAQSLKTDDDQAQAKIADAEVRAKAAEAQVASAKAESQEADTKAESFRLEIAKANEHAAEASKTAESDRLARIKMEQQLKARSLTTDQQQRVTDHIKAFEGTPYEIAVNPTMEPLHLAEQIDSVLRAAGWIPKKSALTNLRLIITLSTGTKAEQTLSTGVSIQLTKPLHEKYGKAAEALILSLRVEGILATGTYLSDSDGSPNNVHVVIGSQELIN